MLFAQQHRPCCAKFALAFDELEPANAFLALTQGDKGVPAAEGYTTSREEQEAILAGRPGGAPFQRGFGRNTSFAASCSATT